MKHRQDKCFEKTVNFFLAESDRRAIYVDLGAEKLLAAEKEGHKIAVEIKNFIGA